MLGTLLASIVSLCCPHWDSPEIFRGVFWDREVFAIESHKYKEGEGDYKFVLGIQRSSFPGQVEKIANIYQLDPPRNDLYNQEVMTDWWQLDIRNGVMWVSTESGTRRIPLPDLIYDEGRLSLKDLKKKFPHLEIYNEKLRKLPYQYWEPKCQFDAYDKAFKQWLGAKSNKYWFDTDYRPLVIHSHSLVPTGPEQCLYFLLKRHVSVMYKVVPNNAIPHYSRPEDVLSVFLLDGGFDKKSQRWQLKERPLCEIGVGFYEGFHAFQAKQRLYFLTRSGAVHYTDWTLENRNRLWAQVLIDPKKDGRVIGSITDFDATTYFFVKDTKNREYYFALGDEGNKKYFSRDDIAPVRAEPGLKAVLEYKQVLPGGSKVEKK